MKNLASLKKGIFLVISTIVFSSESWADTNTQIGLVIGTRPEAIKVIPVFLELRNRGIDAQIIFTGQHKEMVSDIFEIFQVKSQHDFHVMKPGQNLFYLTESIMNKTEHLLQNHKFSCLLVQGDTTSAYITALGAFYAGIPVVHLEAGLRSHNLFRPFPEEAYRQMISRIASLHLAPTQESAQNLLNEGILKERIFVVGNTVTDALRLMQEKILKKEISPSGFLNDFFDHAKNHRHKTILLTSHRRESIPDGIYNIFRSVKTLLSERDDISIIYPMHPNPKIKQVFDEVFDQVPDRLKVCSALNYQDLTYVLQNIDWVFTDSGGIQEEAVSLNKPTLVLREETDRPEAITAQRALLVGTDQVQIRKGIDWLYNQSSFQNRLETPIYGDGFAASKSVDEILRFLQSKKEAN